MRLSAAPRPPAPAPEASESREAAPQKPGIAAVGVKAELMCKFCGEVSEKVPMAAKKETTWAKVGDAIYSCEACGKWVPAIKAPPVTRAPEKPSEDSEPVYDEMNPPPVEDDDELPF